MHYIFRTFVSILSFFYLLIHPNLIGRIRLKRNGLLFLSSVKIERDNEFLLEDGMFYRGKVKISGRGNKLLVYGKVFSSIIEIYSNDSNIIFEADSIVKNARIIVRGENNSFTVGQYTTIGSGCWVVTMGKNKNVSIGKDCMIADDVDIWATDSHPIYSDTNNSIINTSGSICLYDHVWLGKKTTILKNVTIGRNAVVGMGSVVTKDVPEGSVVVGNPAKIVRDHVNWSRQHITV